MVFLVTWVPKADAHDRFLSKRVDDSQVLRLPGVSRLGWPLLSQDRRLQTGGCLKGIVVRCQTRRWTSSEEHLPAILVEPCVRTGSGLEAFCCLRMPHVIIRAFQAQHPLHGARPRSFIAGHEDSYGGSKIRLLFLLPA